MANNLPAWASGQGIERLRVETRTTTRLTKALMWLTVALVIMTAALLLLTFVLLSNQ